MLDFGLAKATADASGPRSDEPPTVTAGGHARRRHSGHGRVHEPGTGAGKPLDKRTDIWAFGCVLYEMLAGRPAFQGESATDILAQVIERDPDWSGLPARLPERVNELLRRCLEKDPRKRRRDIGDVRLELERAPAAATILAVPDGRAPRDARRAWIAATVIALVLTLIVGRQYPLGICRGAPNNRGHRHARDGRRIFVRDLTRWATGRVRRQPQRATGALPSIPR